VHFQVGNGLGMLTRTSEGEKKEQGRRLWRKDGWEEEAFFIVGGGEDNQIKQRERQWMYS